MGDETNTIRSKAKIRSQNRASGRKHRGLTCSNCRARKVRCEGSQPKCKTCEAYHDECRYERLPPMSQVLEMAKRLQEAEQTIAELREAASVAAAAAVLKSPLRVMTARNEDDNGILSGPRTCPDPNSVSQPPFIESTESDTDELPSDSTPKELLTDLSVDENGKICYYGPTSAVHDPPAINSPSSHSSAHRDEMTRANMRSALVATSQESRTWEDFALGAAAARSAIPRPVVAKLLHIHWTWISPMFMWVYRPAFMRDMSTAGPYYSEFLLVVLCAHAARFQDSHVADVLISKARLLLGNAIQQPVSIPTVQALLQLSARELAFGSISHAWLYSGMAFRMARDLGLHHSAVGVTDLKDLGPVDIEVRRRLFWSCYFWDKAISLYTGRMPALTELPDNVTFEFLDDSSEMETWSPYFPGSFSLTRMAPGKYPPMKSHLVSCFANSCKLSVIMNDIISQLYRRWDNSKIRPTLRSITKKLDAWRTESPQHLVCDPDNLPEVSPPPHILSQNLLYYTTVILAHRPFCSVAVHYQACVNAAHAMEQLLLLLEQTFGFDNITYLMAYCIYTGASAIIREARSGSVEANTKIQTFIRALQSGAKRCPLLERSLNLIRKGLHSSCNHDPSPDTMPVFDDATIIHNYIPAFPYFEYSGVGDFELSGYASGMSLDTFSALDCFPEIHMGTFMDTPLSPDLARNTGPHHPV